MQKITKQYILDTLHEACRQARIARDYEREDDSAHDRVIHITNLITRARKLKHAELQVFAKQYGINS